MSLIYNATFDSQTRILSLLDKAGNVISSCEVPSKSNVDVITKPLTFRATQDGSTVKLVKAGSPSGAFQTSEDGGNTWVDYKINSSITLNTDEEVSFRAKYDRTSEQSRGSYFEFSMGGKFEAWHNVMSLYRTNDFATYNTAMRNAFLNLFFNCTSLTKAPALPATTLSDSCYSSMFYGCSSLTKAPALPATTLASECYKEMFNNCTSLTKAPALPATTLSDSCYYNMFFNCPSLTKAPALPATTLSDSCYGNMFKSCTSLTKAPVLLATTLASGCYYSMFKGCTSLVEAPALPAITLESSCYQYMFNNCTSLVEAPTLPATTLAERCYFGMFSGCTLLANAPELPATVLAGRCYESMFSDCSKLKEVRVSATKTATSALNNWLYGVSSTGDFYCDPNATIFPTGASGCPSGWNRRNINLINALTLTATADNSSVKLTKIGTLDNTFEVDTGNGWTAYEFGTVIPLNAGQSCKWRCSAHPTTQSDKNYVKFFMTGAIEASGNCNSMLSRDFENLTSLSGYVYAFYYLFYGCSALTKAPNLPATTLANNCYNSMFVNCKALNEAPNLPATTIASYCYRSMFNGCSSLAKAPELPAKTLRNYCYAYMFRDCTSLTQAPQLPSTTLAMYCYEGLFFGCSSLTQAPQLPSTTLANSCYGGLFYGCRALTNAPDLPATTLDNACYQSMFSGCSALTKAPNLPATTLANNCYRNMFENCSALEEVRIAATTTASDALYRWLQSVSASGTVYAVPSFKDLPTNNVSGIPSGWTRAPLSSYPNP